MKYTAPLLLIAAVACSSPTEPTATRVDLAPSFAKVSCHKSKNKTRCVLLYGGQILAVGSVPLACYSTGWLGCAGALAGAGYAIDTFNEQNPGHDPIWWPWPNKTEDPND